MLELGEDLLDRVEIRAVGGQEDQMSANGADGGSGRLALVRAKIVQDHDISLCERGDEHLVDIGCQEIAVDRFIDHPWRIDTIMTKCGDRRSAFSSAHGTRASSRCPRDPQPRKGAMLVLIHVSSMNTRRLGSILCCRAFQRARLRAISGRDGCVGRTIFLELNLSVCTNSQTVFWCVLMPRAARFAVSLSKDERA